MLSSLRPPPGPSTALPLVGDLPLIGLGKAAGLGPQPHVRMTQLAREHGDVMSLRMGGEPWVVLSSPEMVHEAFVVRGDAFAGRPMVPSMSISSGNGKGFARPTMTPELRALRKTATSALFSSSQVMRSQRWLEDEARRLGDHLVAQSARDGDVAIRPALRRAVSNMVLRYTFSSCGLPYDTGATSAAPPAIVALAKVVDEIWTELTTTPTTALDLVTRQDPGGALASLAYTRLERLVAERDRLLATIVDARKAQRRGSGAGASAPCEGGPDMLDLLLDAGLPEDDVHYALVDNFVAGTNTVSSALEWMLLLCAAHPLDQARARAVLGAPPPPVGSLAPSSPPIVDALLCETLRFKPPLLLPRTATRDAQIGGFAVPRGTVVLANNHALTSDPRWWRDPHVFRPARFLEEEAGLGLLGGSGGGRGSAAACKFIPFSTGQRACPGSRLAAAELRAAASVLLSTTRWSRSPKAASVDLSEAYGLTLTPAVEQRLKFVKFVPVPAARRPVARSARARTASAMMRLTDGASASREGEASGTAPEYGRKGNVRKLARSTRRQKASDIEEAANTDRLREVGTDRRGGCRASKAKGNRRNRRYEKRLLSGTAGAEVELNDD